MIHHVTDLASARGGSHLITDLFRRHYGASFPDVEDILRGSVVVFVSTDIFADFPRPELPNIVHIGGLGLTNSNETLDEVCLGEEGDVAGV